MRADITNASVHQCVFNDSEMCDKNDLTRRIYLRVRFIRSVVAVRGGHCNDK